MSREDADFSSDGWRDVDAGPVSEFAGGLEVAAQRSATARREAAELLGVGSGEVVVDIGCGVGDVLAKLSDTSTRVGVDRSFGLLTNARGSGAMVIQGDGAQLPFRSASVHAVHIARVLLHLERPTLVVHECARVLAPGGRLVVVEPDWQSFSVDAHNRELNAFIEASFRAGVRQPEIGRQLVGMLQDAGLRATDCDVLPVRKVGPQQVDPHGVVKSLLEGARRRGEVSASAVRAWESSWASSDASIVAASRTFRVVAVRD